MFSICSPAEGGMVTPSPSHYTSTGPPPQPGQDRGDGVPPSQVRLQYPSLPARSGQGVPQDGWGTPSGTEQQSEHLLRGTQYASCIHAEGLSFYCLHTKYNGRLYFQFISPHLGGTHLHPIILTLVPCPFWGSTHLHPIILPLVPCPLWRYPSDWSPVPSGRGYHRMEYPQPGQDGGIPRDRVPTPSQVGVNPTRSG